MKDMPSPYRRSDKSVPAPLGELAWRRRMLRSAGWAAGLLAGEMALLVAIPFLPLHLALVGLAAWCVLGAGAAVATWRLTAPEPRSGVDWRGWLLRAAVPAYLGLTGLILLGAQLHLASYVAHSVLLVAATAAQSVTGLLLFVATLAHARRFDRAQWFWSGPLRDFLSWTLVSFPAFVLMDALPLRLWIGLTMLGMATVEFYALRRASLLVDQKWWFDNQTGTPGEWVALLVYRDGTAELRWTEERPGWFASEIAATWWLQQQGYLPAERALAEHLVSAVPPDTVPTARRPKRPRVAQSAPRVRVAADTDPVDEAALDEVEPRRAAAVRRADE